MKMIRLAAAALGMAVAVLTPVAGAADKPGLGQREYVANCAVCHGITGKGDGPYMGLLDARVANLTDLSKRNGGVFPFARVYEVIDGTQVPKAHGTREMPIWGDTYKVRAAEYFVDVPYDPAIFVRARILALTEYLYTLQAK